MGEIIDLLDLASERVMHAADHGDVEALDLALDRYHAISGHRASVRARNSNIVITNKDGTESIWPGL